MQLVDHGSEVFGGDPATTADDARALAYGRSGPGGELLGADQAGIERLAGVQVPAVLAPPEEGLASCDAVHVLGIRGARLQRGEVMLGEVVANQSYDPDFVEERGRQREVCRGAAKETFSLPERRFDGIECDGATTVTLIPVQRRCCRGRRPRAGCRPCRCPSDVDDRGVFEDLLTRRELEVLRLLARGDSNADLAAALVISTGTVKFHVRNILAKLRAANRSEAVSRYHRLVGLGLKDADGG